MTDPHTGTPPDQQPGDPALPASADSAVIQRGRQPGPKPAKRPDSELTWQRLSWRMLLVDPLQMITNLSPIFLVSLWLGTNRSNYWFEASILGIIMLTALSRWISTSYHIGDTHIVLRKGIFSRQRVTIARERIRSVDTESDMYHRLLRVSIVEVGTGQQDAAKNDAGRFRLDAIASSAVEPLREDLLQHMRQINPDLELGDEKQWGSRYGEDIAKWKITWARFAPFSPLGFGVLFSLWLITLQMGDMQDRLLQLSWVVSLRTTLAELGQPWTVLGEAAGVWAVAGLLAMLTYAIRFGKYALLDHGRVLYIQNGILRRKHIALDRERLRGVEMRMPVAVRMIGGGRLEPIMTGTKRGSKASTLLPLAPLRDVRRVARRVLGTDAPVDVPLRRHPFVAKRRRITRGLFPVYWIAAGAALLRWDKGAAVDPWIQWFAIPVVVLFVLLSWDRIRMLGHNVVDGHLVSSHGSLQAKRVALAADGIVGWQFSQSPFQRWGKVAVLRAATPAGQGVYAILDMADREAWALAEAITPGITAEWGTIRRVQPDGQTVVVSEPAIPDEPARPA